MKIVFLSNFLTPHQLPLAKAFCNISEFFFIECVDVDRSALPIGWLQEGEFDFVVPYEKLCRDLDYYINLITQADVVITGSAPDFLIKKRLKNKKLTFKYSERVYKKKCPWYEIPLRAVKYFWQYGRYKNLYLLCASAYTAGDYAKTGTFINKAFKWGYFPETKEYDIEKLISKKQANSILWAGRFIDWKHPELAIEVARRLKDEGFDFSLNIIGSGEMQEQIEKLITTYALQNEVKLLGSMTPGQVREYMEKSEIYLFTSDRQEGWGAVLNESMNSGCAVVGSSAIGSVPFLINDGENGFIYKDGNTDDLYAKVKELMQDSLKRHQAGKEAYKTIAEQWNAEMAAERIVELSANLLSRSKETFIFETGICSKSESINSD